MSGNHCCLWDGAPLDRCKALELRICLASFFLNKGEIITPVDFSPLFLLVYRQVKTCSNKDNLVNFH